ncbi:hypothetical protein EDB85DRAFT_2035412, partial [Lactarius pseudohatsudake]
MPPPLPHPLSAPPRSGGKAAHEGTPSSPPFPPCPCRVEGTRVGTPLPLLAVTPGSPCPLSAPPTSPSLPAPPFPFARKEWAQGYAAVSPLGASLLHSRGRDAHEGTPPLRLRSHPFPLGRAAHSHRRGRGHAATRRHPSPLAAPPRYAGRGHVRERHPRPHPSIRAEGCARACRPLPPSPPTPPLPAPYARDEGTRGHATPSPPPFLIRAEGG